MNPAEETNKARTAAVSSRSITHRRLKTKSHPRTSMDLPERMISSIQLKTTLRLSVIKMRKSRQFLSSRQNPLPTIKTLTPQRRNKIKKAKQRYSRHQKASKSKKGKKNYSNQMVKLSELIKEPSSRMNRPPLNLYRTLTK